VTDYVSPSRLSLWLKCPLAFKLKYIDGVCLPTPPALFLGKQVHAGMEWYYRNRLLGSPVTFEALCRFLQHDWDRSVAAESMRFRSVAEETQLQSKVVQLLQTYLAKVASETARPLGVEIAVEAPLIDPRTGEDLGIPLVGVIDLVLKEDSGPVIIDFKTAARAQNMLELSYEIQCGCYSYLFRQTTGMPEAALEIRRLVKTQPPQISFHRWPARSSSHLGRLFAVIRAYLENCQSRRFIYRPGLSCSSCDFREPHCRTWTG
jgi:putative RecB family exonuclease